MPFRSKIKKAFGGSEKPEGPVGTTKSVTEAIAKKDKAAKSNTWFSSTSKEDKYKDWPAHLYKPHEIPPPKYKRPDPKTQKGLKDYGFDKATHDEERRASHTSECSPMGSRLMSRRSSQASPLGSSTAINGVDPGEPKNNEDEEDWPLTQVETVKPANVGALRTDAKESDRTGSSDAFDSSELSRALTAIKDDGQGPQTATVSA